MHKIIHIKLTTIITTILAISILWSAYAFADEADSSATYTTPLLPNVTDYNVAGDVVVDVNVAAVNALEITLSSSRIYLDLVPGMVESDFKSDTLNILVGTTNATGYTLTMATSYDNESTTSLTRTSAINGDNPTIGTIESSVSPGVFSSPSDTTTMNKWGYLLSTTNLDINKTKYSPIETSLQLNSNTTPVSNDPTVLTLGAKVDNTLPAGNYKATLKFMAVTNPLGSYTVNYYSNPYQIYNSGTLAKIYMNQGRTYWRQYTKVNTGNALAMVMHDTDFPWAGHPENAGLHRVALVSSQPNSVSMRVVETSGDNTTATSSTAATFDYEGSTYYHASPWGNNGRQYYAIDYGLAQATPNNLVDYNATPVNYSTILQYNDSQSAKKSQTVELYRTAYVEQNTFTRSGMTFQGWSTTPTGDVMYTGGEEIYNWADADGVVKLYAIWR